MGGLIQLSPLPHPPIPPGSGAGAAAGLCVFLEDHHQRGERRVPAGSRGHAAVPRHPRRSRRVPGKEPALVQLPGHDAAVGRTPVQEAVRAVVADVSGALRNGNGDTLLWRGLKAPALSVKT